MEDLKPTAPNTTPLTPLTFLERAAIVYGECTSIIYNNTTYTWSETNRRCLQAASAISSALGILRGQVVSVLAPNVPAAYELHFAVPMAGAILNNINTRLNATTISVILHHSESKLVFVHQQLRSLVLQALSLLPSDHPRPSLVLIQDDGDEDICLKDNIYYDDKKSFSWTYERLIEKGDPGFEWIRPESEWDPIALNYTSGTTASPKGVVTCHRGSFVAALTVLMDWSVPQQPVYLWTLPMFHCNGWSFAWGMAAVGATNICLWSLDGGAAIHTAIRRHHVTYMCAAPVLLNMLINTSLGHTPINWPVHVLTSASPPPAPVLVRAEELGFTISHGYGLTEIGGPIISCAWKPNWNRLSIYSRAQLKARQGVGNLGVAEIDVIDPDTLVPIKRDGKTIGEIVIRGPSVMLGYLKDPEATSKCMGKGGWFRTGDLGVMHSDGYLEIKDRSKDVIISGGENISSVEVESVLYTFPLVFEAAVVAQPHEFWGETPCAFVSLKQETGDFSANTLEKEIIDYCRAKLPHYMAPKRVVFKDELPKSSTGKIQKFVLREMARTMANGPNQTSTAIL